MAMESAAVLNDELLRVNAKQIPTAIELFIKRRRDRVDAIQSQSRQLLKVMALQSPLLTQARNVVVRFLSEEQMFGSIAKRLNQPI